MSHVAFDTLKFVEKLKAAGMPERQAIALSEAQNEALTETTDHFLASKADIYQLKQEIGEVKSNQKLMQWMMGFILTGTSALIIKAFIPM